MRTMLLLAVAHIRYYRKQTAALFFGILLSAALFAGIGSLFESGNRAALEHARAAYGDWHYNMRGDAAWAEAFFEEPQGNGYQLEALGIETVRRFLEEPLPLQLVYADPTYLDMMGREFLQGRYPQQEHEIALDEHTLRNLNVPPELGSEVVLGGETFTLCGILTGMPEKLSSLMGDFSQAFVNSTLDYGENGTFLYLKFKEDGHVYRQVQSFCSRFGISGGDLRRNNGISPFVGAGIPTSAWETIKEGLAHKGAGIPYIWGQLNAHGVLTEQAILIAVGLFGVFIIFSLFQISVGKRMAQYSVMQTVGMSDAATFGALLAELCLISAAAYPAGGLLGNGIAALLYQRVGRIFIPQSQVVHTGASGQTPGNAVSNLPSAGRFFVSRSWFLWGVVLLFCFLCLISWLLVRRMKRATVRQLMAEETGARRRSRKLYSLHHENMAGILTRKFMFARRGTFWGILLSLSAGSLLFLGVSYVTENTKRNNELTFKADDGLGSDIQVYEESDHLADTIPEEAVRQMTAVAGIGELHPVRYLLGEILLADGTFLWPEYYPELGYADYEPDAALMEKYNGIAVQTGEDDFRLKVNIYGYDDAMLEELGDYLLEGSIDPDRMRRENSVILKTVMDGQGNMDGIDVHPGDAIPVRAVSSLDVPAEAYRFLGEDGWYQETSLTVAAVSARQLAKVDTFIGDSYDMVVDLIMTNEQLETNFGVSDYRTVSISLAEDAAPDQTADALAKVVAGIPRCVVKDYSRQIAAQNLYLAQKMLFFCGIAAVLFGISILQIANSMQHLILERHREFGILRAMGITDANFCSMLAREGLRYGLYSSLLITVLFFFVQRVLYFFLVHVYLYLQPSAFLSWPPFAAVLGLNVVICVAVVLLSGRAVLRQEIVDVIYE